MKLATIIVCSELSHLPSFKIMLGNLALRLFLHKNKQNEQNNCDKVTGMRVADLVGGGRGLKGGGE